MLNVRIRLAVLIMIFCVSGCSTQASRPQLYTLHASTMPAEKDANTVVGAIGVGPITLPESLRRTEVVLFDSSNQILVDDRYRWAGDLKQAISRVMASNLSAQLGKDDVWAFPWDVRTRPDTQVSLVIEHLGGQLGQSVTLDAKWKVVTDQGSKILSVGRCMLQRKSDLASYSAYVAAINTLVEGCSSVVVENLMSKKY